MGEEPISLVEILVKASKRLAKQWKTPLRVDGRMAVYLPERSFVIEF